MDALQPQDLFEPAVFERHGAEAMAITPPPAGSAERSALAGHAPVRRVALLLDPARVRLVHRELAGRLAHRAGLLVTLLAGHAEQPPPSSLELLLALERLVHRIAGPRLADRTEWQTLEAAVHSPAEPPDVIVNLCGDGTAARGGRVLRVLYDGMAGENFLVGALLAGRMPTIEIEEAGTGLVLARGIPCADNAGSLVEALECALARVMTLVISSLARPRAPLGPASRSTARSSRLRDMAAFEAKSLAQGIVHRLYRLCFYTPHWRVCWRFLDGPDLWDTQTLVGTSWRILPDPGFRFYTDPFPFIHEGKTWLFVEELDHRANKGVISVVPFDEHGPTGPAEPVLEEPWHLSYPFVFAHEGRVWMIPESSAGRTITLYRADPFPHRWVVEEVLLADIEASDATIIRRDDCLWMLAATRDGAGSWSDTLSIFSAPALRGPWRPHAANPVIVDQAAARPAGAMFVRDGKLWRPVQDCAAGYGTGIGLVEVTRLTHDAFEQRTHAVLRADPSWPGRRLHTLNRAGRLECIDGAAYSPRSRSLARRLQGWSGRREPDCG
jgi:hypothetical protein